MASVTREQIGTLHDKITVKLTKEDYWPSFEKSLKHYAKSANVPGFRKGMVPAGMVRKMYGQSIFSDEVLRTAGGKLEEYLKNESVAIFAQPLVMPNEKPMSLDMNNPSEVDFAFEIGLKPDFTLPELSKTKLTRYKIAVADTMLNDEVDRIAKRYGKADAIPAVASKEDIIYSKYELCDAEGNVAAESQMVEDTVLLEKLPAKMQDMLMGKKADDTMVIRPSEICTPEELAGFMKDPLKQGVEAADNYYKFTLVKVAKLIPHEVNAELFAQVFPNAEVKDEAEFRELIRTELSREYTRIATDRLQNEIYEYLVHNINIQLPVDFLKRWMKEGGDKPKSAEEVEREFPSFDHQLRWTLISDKLILDNGINVSRDEVLEDIKGRVLSYFGMAAGEDAPWMEGYLAKVMKDEKTMDETYRRLLFNKLFSYLETQFTVADQDITEEEFFKLQDAHAAHHHHH